MQTEHVLSVVLRKGVDWLGKTIQQINMKHMNKQILCKQLVKPKSILMQINNFSFERWNDAKG